MEAEAVTTVEIDAYDLYKEMEDQIQDAAYESARSVVEDWDFSSHIDYADGAADLLRDYRPGHGCALGQLFEDKVQGAVTAGDFLAEAIKEVVTTLGTSAEISTSEVRNIVREEIRDALSAARTAVQPAPIV